MCHAEVLDLVANYLRRFDCDLLLGRFSPRPLDHGVISASHLYAARWTLGLLLPVSIPGQTGGGSKFWSASFGRAALERLTIWGTVLDAGGFCVPCARYT